MFLIKISYKKPLTIVDQYLPLHRAFLEEGYQKDLFIVSGPQNPRIGGVILSQLTDREELENLIKQDPYYLNEVADFEITEFSPVKFHPDFASFIR